MLYFFVRQHENIIHLMELNNRWSPSTPKISKGERKKNFKKLVQQIVQVADFYFCIFFFFTLVTLHGSLNTIT